MQHVLLDYLLLKNMSLHFFVTTAPAAIKLYFSIIIPQTIVALAPIVDPFLTKVFLYFFFIN